MYDQAQKNTQLLRERAEAARRVAQLENELVDERRRLAGYLKTHDEAAKSFAIERREHEAAMKKLDAQYKSLKQKNQGECFVIFEELDFFKSSASDYLFCRTQASRSHRK